MQKTSARVWAEEEFRAAALGDARRTTRLIRIASRAAVAPCGKISEVFRDPAERQGAYDFVESSHVRSAALLAALTRSAAIRCSTYGFVFVPVDGTSLTLVDHEGTKDFGAIGTYGQGARGLKVIDAIAVSPDGIPLGVLAMQWWVRPSERPAHRQRPNCARKVKDKETQHWLDAIDQVGASLAVCAPSTCAWFQLDREGDAWPVLRHLEASGHWFTVRSRSDRRLRTSPRERRYLRETLRRARPVVVDRLHVPARPGRKERDARMVLRAATVTLDLLNGWTKAHCRLTVNAVWAREEGTAPREEQPLDWLLLTNHPIDSVGDVRLVVFGYTQRWRIEDFHKTWKSGGCRVEETQLRARDHVVKWATILAAVAMRIERLKHLSRTSPELTADVELTPREIQALIVLKRAQRKRTEQVADDTPTIGQAVRWIAEIGGYTGRSSGGPPGSITLGRGLERLRVATEVLESLAQRGKLR
jgi:hypothetical protein